jgi:hypothetical protein
MQKKKGSSIKERPHAVLAKNAKSAMSRGAVAGHPSVIKKPVLPHVKIEP